MKKIFLNEQSFNLLRKDNGLYVDKTKRIYDVIQYSRYIFLSRPRRFGKSLLVSTLEALYLGKKELFKGLWIENNWKWEEYPVLRFDFSTLESGKSPEDIDMALNITLKRFAKTYGLETYGNTPATILNFLLEDVYLQTGKGVVILIDEYDNPITSHLSNVQLAQRNRDYFRPIYRVLKSKSDFLQFVFMTGISKFAKMSIFSAISQMKDISLLSEFNDIVGFTEEELISNFSKHLARFGQANNMEQEEVREYIQKWYDGYSWNGVQHIYNPYAILNALADRKLKPYWFETGTPSFLIQLVTKNQSFKEKNATFLQQLDSLTATEETFDSYDLENINITAALFQSGYLTVKEVKKKLHLENFILGFPNYEVRHAFNAHLLKAFLKDDIATNIKSRSIALLEALEAQNKDKFQQIVISIFSGIPSPNLRNINEFGYQAMFYQLLLLLGINDIFLEVAGYIGRADGVLLLDDKVFIFEFKFARQGTMEYLLDKASEQAELKGYWHPYLDTEKKIFRVAVGFLYKKPKDGEKEVLSIDSHWKKIVRQEDYD